MIPADLLNQLREKDPELWNTFSEKKIGDYFYFGPEGDEEYGDIFEYQLEDSARCAWLQHCLQEAIRARGWHLYQIRNDDLPGLPCFADIIILGHGKEHDIHNEGEGSTESEALLRAYLAAIQEAE